MNIQFELGTERDIDELEQLYDKINDYLESGVNYPGWRKGIYPVRENAINGVQNRTLYLAKYKEIIIGSVILSHIPEPVYNKAKWQITVEDSEVIVIYTFVVHPEFLRMGVGKAIMGFIEDFSRQTKAKTIRLDVYEGNHPAIKLYETCGYRFIDKVDLGYGNYGLDWFYLYEKVL